MKRAKGLYDFYEVPAGSAAALELRDFGEEANSGLPNWRRKARVGRAVDEAVQVAEGGTGLGRTMGELLGGAAGGALGSRFGKFGEGLGGAIGYKLGGAIGSTLDGPVPESVARGVLTPNERDYPGYWGYSGDDGLGGWRRSR